MEKSQFTKIQLAKGEMAVYDFGTVKLHAYKTNDLIADECFLVEKAGRAFMIESPCFFDNLAEVEKYILENGWAFEGTVIAYHGAGASFGKSLKNGSKVYSTKTADDYNHKGGGAALVANFTKAFGDAFDKSIFTTSNFIEGEKLTLAGVELKIVPTADAFDIEIPEINVVYTHMLGHDVHSIVAGSAHADALIATLNGYIQKKISLVLTSHYTVENLEDVKTKIEYLKDLKNIAIKNPDAVAFKTAVQKKYPSYSGANYLEMTGGMFFPAK